LKRVDTRKFNPDDLMSLSQGTPALCVFYTFLGGVTFTRNSFAGAHCGSSVLRNFYGIIFMLRGDLKFEIRTDAKRADFGFRLPLITYIHGSFYGGIVTRITYHKCTFTNF